MLGKIPYNVGKPLRALTTKFLLETKEMAELITLGMVIMSRIGQSAGKIPKLKNMEFPQRLNGCRRIKSLKI